MQVLSHLLLSGESYPMHKALIESNIGSDYSAGTGYDDNARYIKHRLYNIHIQYLYY